MMSTIMYSHVKVTCWKWLICTSEGFMKEFVKGVVMKSKMRYPWSVLISSCADVVVACVAHDAEHDDWQAQSSPSISTCGITMST